MFLSVAIHLSVCWMYHVNGVCVDESLCSNAAHAVHQSLLAAEEQLHFLSEGMTGADTVFILLVQLTNNCKRSRETYPSKRVLKY